MEIIASEDFTLTDSIKEAIHESVSKISEHAGEDIYTHVYLRKEGSEFSVKLKTHFMGEDIFAEALNADFYKATKEARNKFSRQITDLKKKKHSHH